MGNSYKFQLTGGSFAGGPDQYLLAIAPIRILHKIYLNKIAINLKINSIFFENNVFHFPAKNYDHHGAETRFLQNAWTFNWFPCAHGKSKKLNSL